MTSQTIDDAANAGEAPAVRPGIYLEEKTGAIGVGGTAKTAQYRTFWVTLLISEANVEMLLLNDDFRPTAVRETFPVAVVQGPGWHYIAEGEKRYNKLRPHLDRILLA
ncbi:MAG: hypothetical protein LBS31_06440, partial [Candidatus Adiutrix sp.]|nr:hypothetical protein [Candidatus Adiutrix sp.]